MVNVRISFVTFTRNSGERLRGLLEHVKDVVDEIIVIDGCSTDDTVEIALSYGAKVYRRRPRGHVEPDRMFALSRANHDWILYLDDDERLSKHLKRDLREIIARFGTEYKVFPVYRVELCKHDIPVSAGLQIRVYHKNYVLYKGLVHELPEVLGPAITLDPREYFIVHRPKYFREHFRKSGLIAYAYLESMEYPDPFRFKSPIRRTLYKLMPFSCALYLLYSVVKPFVERGEFEGEVLGLDGVTRVECSIVSASRHFIETSLVIALYELLVGVMMRLRDDKRRRIAEYVYRKGLIDILESLEKRRTTVILC